MCKTAFLRSNIQAEYASAQKQANDKTFSFRFIKYYYSSVTITECTLRPAGFTSRGKKKIRDDYALSRSVKRFLHDTKRHLEIFSLVMKCIPFLLSILSFPVGKMRSTMFLETRATQCFIAMNTRFHEPCSDNLKVLTVKVTHL